MIKLVVSKNDSGQTLLNFLKKIFKQESLAKIYHLFYQHKIKVNEQKISNFKYKIAENDVIIIYDRLLQYQKRETTFLPDPGQKLLIQYEDQNIIIAIKPHNLVIHSPVLLSLDNIVRYYLQNRELAIINDSLTFTISHLYRLDKLTAGLVIYPKNKSSYDLLQQAQKIKTINKYYYALVKGVFLNKQWQTVTGFIKKDEAKQKMVFTMTEVANSKKCITLIRLIYHNNKYSLLECQLITGRKHQIRATLSFLGYPIVGDKKYGATIILDHKIMLFAYKIAFMELKDLLGYLSQQVFIMKDLKTKLIRVIDSDFKKNDKMIM